jgi:hypothetical protein
MNSLAEHWGLEELNVPPGFNDPAGGTLGVGGAQCSARVLNDPAWRNIEG